ncbi:hypothetical protein K7432_006764 [Basidiobolus ranarum]|uniref:HMG box domain-containing protein n=1 Tax=Basidiobolus ranarum TaxID=34480 RepID=A0ABR2W145_9FUNG
MLRITSSVRVNNILANSVTQFQRGYAASVKASKIVDEKLTPPKRPLSAYLQFHREVFNALSPEEKTSVTATSKTIGEKWRNLAESEKKHYQDIAENNKKEYEVKCKNFLNSLSPSDYVKLAQIRKQNKAKGKNFPKFKDPNAPRKPMTSYVLFLKEKYDELNTGNNTETFRKIAEEWRQTPESGRKVYEELAAEDRVRYDQEVRRYMQ